MPSRDTMPPDRVGGLYRASLHQYTAVYNTDLAAYRRTVLAAFQQVEDYLAALRIYSQELQRQQEAVKSAQEMPRPCTIAPSNSIDLT